MLSVSRSSHASDASTSLAIDFATSDNSSTSVGTIQNCLEVASGATYTVDVDIVNVNDVAAAQLTLNYRGTVTARNVANSLINNEVPDVGGSAYIDPSSPLPDVSGFDTVSIINDIASLGGAGASGSGILIRYTMTAPTVSSPTFVPMTLTNTALANFHFVNAPSDIPHSDQGGFLAVAGASCTSTPTPAPAGETPTPTPAATSTATPTPTPCPECTPTPTPAPASLAIDFATSDNSSTSVGTIQNCLELASGATYTVDVDIVNASNVVAAQLTLNYQGELTGRSVTDSLLQTAAGGESAAAIVGVASSHNLPDASGAHTVVISNDAAIANGVGASGSGILIRFTMTAPTVGTPSFFPMTLGNTVLDLSLIHI